MRLTTLALGFGLLAASTVAEPITYQGSLESASVPGKGLYDFRFRLYDQASLGNQVGPELTRENTSVSHGLFMVELDFGADAFDAPRWLEIDARPDGAGAHETLAPRQPLHPAPAAIEHRTEPWNALVNGITHGAGANRVLINRDTTITGNEYFGLTAPAGPDVYGGMYVNTSDPNGRPFYGYATDGTTRCFSYYDHTEGDLVLHNVGPRLIVSDSGEVSSVGTLVAQSDLVVASDQITFGEALVQFDVSAADFVYNEPKPHFYSVPPEAFRPTSHLAEYLSGSVQGSSLLYSTSPTSSLRAPVYLPDGAEVTAMRFYFIDNAADAKLQMSLIRREFTANTVQTMAAVESNTLGAATSVQWLTDSTPIHEIIDNSAYTYILSAYSENWSNADTQIKGVRIEYTVATPD